jgi:hypothetical protein
VSLWVDASRRSIYVGGLLRDFWQSFYTRHDLTNLGQRGQLLIFLYCVQILCNIRMQIRRSLAKHRPSSQSKFSFSSQLWTTFVKVHIGGFLIRQVWWHFALWGLCSGIMLLCVWWEDRRRATHFHSCSEDWVDVYVFRYHPANHI